MNPFFLNLPSMLLLVAAGTFAHPMTSCLPACLPFAAPSAPPGGGDGRVGQLTVKPSQQSASKRRGVRSEEPAARNPNPLQPVRAQIPGENVRL